MCACVREKLSLRCYLHNPKEESVGLRRGCLEKRAEWGRGKGGQFPIPLFSSSSSSSSPGRPGFIAIIADVSLLSPSFACMRGLEGKGGGGGTGARRAADGRSRGRHTAPKMWTGFEFDNAKKNYYTSQSSFSYVCQMLVNSLTITVAYTTNVRREEGRSLPRSVKEVRSR